MRKYQKLCKYSNLCGKFEVVYYDLLMKHLSSCHFFAAWLALLLASACNSQSPSSYQSIQIEAFIEAASNPDVQIVDVRTEQEFVRGHIPGAVNIDVKDKEFVQVVNKKLDKQHPVLVYCQSGRRSKIAADLLSGMGFQVKELDCGIAGWNGKVAYGAN